MRDTSGKDIFHKLARCLNCYVTLVCVVSDGSPVITGSKKGLKNFAVQFSLHFIIHKEVLCDKMLKLNHILKSRVIIFMCLRIKS